jgi:hypothetical protein
MAEPSKLRSFTQLWQKYRLIMLSVTLTLLIAISHHGALDNAGQSYTYEGFKRALITYGIARGLNAVISVAQGTEISVQPAGVGVVFTPGEILDPINDLIERFSWIMLASTTSLGIQRVLLQATASATFTWIVTVSMALFLVVLWRRAAVPGDLRHFIARIAIMLLILRFMIPVIAIANEGVYRAFLQPEYDASAAKLEVAADNIGQISVQADIEQPAEQEGSLLKKLEKTFDAATDNINIQKRMDSLRLAADDIAEHTINLIVVFALQTILFPLFFLWIGLQLVRKSLDWRLTVKQE